jgi:hypothetical protein
MNSQLKGPLSMSELNDDAVARRLSKLFEERLAPLGLEKVEFEGGADHDGDPAIFATISYRSGAGKFDADAFLDTIVEAMRRLREAGDERFVHVRHRHADGEDAIGDGAGPAGRLAD